MPRIKVIIVRDRDSSGGGIVNYYKAVMPHLESKIQFCDVGKPHSFYEGEKSGFRFTILRLGLDWLALFCKILWFRPDLVHLNPGLDVTSFRSMRRDAVNLLISKFLRRRVLVFWRGWHNSWCGKPEFPKGNGGWLSRIYRMAVAHIVLASRFRHDLLSWGFAEPVYLETTVVSDECLCPSSGRAEPGSGKKHLLFLSRVEEAKGVFELLAAFRLVKREFPDSTLTFAGDGPDLEALRKEARQQGDEGVEFTGFVSGAAKVACFQKATIFCFPSYTEGMPNAVLEAMAMGLPVLASQVGGLRDILDEGKTGLSLNMVPGSAARERFDPTTMAESISVLLRDPERLAKIGSFNSDLARERFSAKQVAARLETIYQKTIEDINNYSITENTQERAICS